MDRAKFAQAEEYFHARERSARWLCDGFAGGDDRGQIEAGRLLQLAHCGDAVDTGGAPG